MGRIVTFARPRQVAIVEVEDPALAPDKVRIATPEVEA
jgi:hypothetical protein